MSKNDLLEGLGQLKMRPWINTGDVALGIMSEHNNYLESTMKRIENTEDEETIRLLFKGLKYEAMSMHFRFMRALKENEVKGNSFQDKVDEATFNEVTEHILKFLGGIEEVQFKDTGVDFGQLKTDIQTLEKFVEEVTGRKSSQALRNELVRPAKYMSVIRKKIAVQSRESLKESGEITDFIYIMSGICNKQAHILSPIVIDKILMPLAQDVFSEEVEISDEELERIKNIDSFTEKE